MSVLRTHIAHSPEHRSGIGHREGPGRISGAYCGRMLSQAEIEDLNPAVARDRNIIRFEVAMDKSAACAAARPSAIWTATSSSFCMLSGLRTGSPSTYSVAMSFVPTSLNLRNVRMMQCGDGSG